MSYLTIISLPEAKNYLRVDDDLTEDDARITSMIKSAFSYLERITNVIVYQRDKTYLAVDGCVHVYDYPINGVTTPTDYDSENTVRKNGYSIYNYGSETTDITLSVGYADATNYPTELREVAFEIIDLMYYEHETGKSYIKDLSEFSKGVIENHRRFII